MSKENLSVVLKQKNDLRLENRPIPEPGPEDVLIAIHSVGICGSDIHFLTSGRIGNFIVEAPMVLGHESSGTVVKTGKNVKDLKPGDRVAIEPAISCRHCNVCKSGRYNLCPNVKGCSTPELDGTLCRYYVHPADFCHKLPPEINFEEGALLEPLSVAVHTCRRAKITAGSSVLVCGAGPIGLLCILTAKAMGATRICVTDVIESRLKFAKQLGATCQIDARDKDVDTIAQYVQECLGSQPDVTLECSGAVFSIKLAFQVTKAGGTVLLVGASPPECTVSLVNASTREINIKGTFRYANDFPIAIDLIASGAIDVKPLVTHRFKLENSLQAFETSRTGADGAIKVIIQCQD